MSSPQIHTLGSRMYFILDPKRDGLLTWMHDGKCYLMAFTSGELADEYNEKVLQNTGETIIYKQSEGPLLAKRMVKAGVEWMLIDYPPINDDVELWAPVDRRLGRDYSIVYLKGIAAVT